MTERPAIDLAIVMERETAPNQWEAWRHRPVEEPADRAASGYGSGNVHQACSSRSGHREFTRRRFGNRIAPGLHGKERTLRVGEEARWRTPDGRDTRGEVVAILFQPEASGDYTI